MDSALREAELDFRRREEQIKASLEKNRADRLKTIRGNDLAIERLERQIDLLTKDVASLKKEALSGADLKPVIDRIKKLEK